MGASKDEMFRQQEAEGRESVAECQSCGGDVTADELNEMPYDGGEPVFVMCSKCWNEDGYDSDEIDQNEMDALNARVTERYRIDLILLKHAQIIEHMRQTIENKDDEIRNLRLELRLAQCPR